MNKKLLIACAAAFAAFFSPLQAEPTQIPGSLETEARLKQSGEHYKSVLLAYCIEYWSAIWNGDPTCSGDNIPSLAGLPVAEARTHIIARIKEHPEEINDAGYQDGESSSALDLAVSHKDVELVKLLLEYGAIPYKPGYNGRMSLRGSELRTLVMEARKKWPEVEIYPYPFEKLRKSGKIAN